MGEELIAWLVVVAIQLNHMMGIADDVATILIRMEEGRKKGGGEMVDYCEKLEVKVDDADGPTPNKQVVLLAASVDGQRGKITTTTTIIYYYYYCYYYYQLPTTVVVVLLPLSPPTLLLFVLLFLLTQYPVSTKVRNQWTAWGITSIGAISSSTSPSSNVMSTLAGPEESEG